MSDLRTSDVAERLGCSHYKVYSLARTLGVGIDLGGPAGFRFNEAEYERMRASMRVLPKPGRKRSRNRGRGRVA